MKSLSKISIALFIVAAFLSCSEKPDVEYTTPYKLAGEWWATMKVGTQDVGGGYKKIATYNTASNTNEIWVDDLKHLYGFKVKAAGDPVNMAFSAANSSNPYYVGTAAFPKTVTITNGKILPDLGKTKSGNPVDSIYREAEFSDDPGTKYLISGHFSTGFQEDAY